jgi:hypothetical protein
MKRSAPFGIPTAHQADSTVATKMLAPTKTDDINLKNAPPAVSNADPTCWTQSTPTAIKVQPRIGRHKFAEIVLHRIPNSCLQ